MFEKNMKILLCDEIFEWKIWKKEEGEGELLRCWKMFSWNMSKYEEYELVEMTKKYW